MKSIRAFNLEPGYVLCDKFEVVNLLGAGWEGEVYKIIEISTGIERAAKIFYPQRNIRDKTAKFYAKQLHKLRDCPILIQYHAREILQFNEKNVTVLISEYVEGELLVNFIRQRPGKRLTAYEALHLLYALTLGIEQIHRVNEYHGDLHSENIIVSRYGLSFDLKLLDLYLSDQPKRQSQKEDIVDLIRIFHEALGGAKHYSRHIDEVKKICCGLKSGLILKKFRSAGQLRRYLENMHWN